MFDSNNINLSSNNENFSLENEQATNLLQLYEELKEKIKNLHELKDNKEEINQLVLKLQLLYNHALSENLLNIKSEILRFTWVSMGKLFTTGNITQELYGRYSFCAFLKIAYTIPYYNDFSDIKKKFLTAIITCNPMERKIIRACQKHYFIGLIDQDPSLIPTLKNFDEELNIKLNMRFYTTDKCLYYITKDKFLYFKLNIELLLCYYPEVSHYSEIKIFLQYMHTNKFYNDIDFNDFYRLIFSLDNILLKLENDFAFACVILSPIINNNLELKTMLENLLNGEENKNYPKLKSLLIKPPEILPLLPPLSPATWNSLDPEEQVILSGISRMPETITPTFNAQSFLGNIPVNPNNTSQSRNKTSP